jgi:hypothetical protein
MRTRKPFYKRRWFIIVCVVIIIAALVPNNDDKSNTKNDVTTSSIATTEGDKELNHEKDLEQAEETASKPDESIIDPIDDSSNDKTQQIVDNSEEPLSEPVVRSSVSDVSTPAKSTPDVQLVETPKISRKSAKITTGNTISLKMKGSSQNISWSSSDRSVATVNSKGKITAKSAGKCTIYAQIGDDKYKCKVVVSAPKQVPVSEPEIEVEVEEVAGSVWISETGSKFHSIPDCGRMNPDNATQMSQTNAEAQGYERCSKCF